MKLKLTVLFVSFFAIMFYSCKKEVGQKDFPTETHTGANTFGCYIDGKPLLPCKRVPTLSPIKNLSASEYNYVNNFTHYSIGISAYNDCDESFVYGRSLSIRFDSVAIATNTSYKLGKYYDSVPDVSILYMQDLVTYYSDSSLNGNLTVTYFDSNKRILSGNFDAFLKTFDGTKSVHVTSGVFDVRY